MAKIFPARPLLIMLYGFPGAGKTYFARQLCEKIQAAHIQSDRIRYELFEQPQYDKQENAVIAQLGNYMTEEFLSAGLSVVYDVNAFRSSQRRQLRDLARKTKAVPVLIWLQIDTESAFQRTANRDRRRTDDKYSRPIERQLFDKIVTHSQNPGATEEYIVISGKHNFETQAHNTLKRLRELSLVPTEGAPKVVKPELVNLIPNAVAGRVDMTRRNIVIR